MATGQDAPVFLGWLRDPRTWLGVFTQYAPTLSAKHDFRPANVHLLLEQIPSPFALSLSTLDRAVIQGRPEPAKTSPFEARDNGESQDAAEMPRHQVRTTRQRSGNKRAKVSSCLARLARAV